MRHGETIVKPLAVLLFFFLPALQACSKAPQKPLPSPLVYSRDYSISLLGLERLHPFDSHKHRKIFSAIKHDYDVSAGGLHQPIELQQADYRLVHTQAALDSWTEPEAVSKALEMPILATLPRGLIAKSIVRPFQLAAGGTVKAGELAVTHGCAINLGGGFHHASPSRGEGFCLIADVAISIRKLQRSGKIKTALVIDTDAHQGNGTILCFAGDSAIHTYSIHQEGIYPEPKEKGTLDRALPAGTLDASYLKVLKSDLERIFESFQPDIVYHVAGADVLDGDPLAGLALSVEGLVARDLLVFREVRKRGIPYVHTLAGGYGPVSWKAQARSILAILNEQDSREP